MSCTVRAWTWVTDPAVIEVLQRPCAKHDADVLLSAQHDLAIALSTSTALPTPGLPTRPPLNA
jgi:hypothetical protein